MITRIVKMKFQEQYISDFKNFTKDIKNIIRNQEGCLHLEILQDISDPHFFFTYSKWDSEEDLNNYRKSDFLEIFGLKLKSGFLRSHRLGVLVV